MLNISPRFRLLALVPAASFAIYACSGSDTETTPDQAGPPPGYEDVVLAGDVTDETLVGFVQKLEKGAPVEDEQQSPVIDWPADGAKLLKDALSPFCWRYGSETALNHASGDRVWAALDPAPARAQASWARPLLDLLGPPRKALAHGEPFNGYAAYLVFSTKSNPKLLRVLSSETVFTPSKEAWNAMIAAGEPITLSPVSAFFDENRVPQDGGPFAGKSITFTIVSE